MIVKTGIFTMKWSDEDVMDYRFSLKEKAGKLYYKSSWHSMESRESTPIEHMTPTGRTVTEARYKRAIYDFKSSNTNASKSSGG